MRKRLAVVALVGLSFSASMVLPSIASAGEPTRHCTSLPCTYTVQSTGNITISSTDGVAVTCTSLAGNGAAGTLAGTTGTLQLRFHGCKETLTGFGFACSSPDEPSGTMTLNVMPSHNIWIDAAKATPGIIWTAASMTYRCAGGQPGTRITGNLIGHMETPQCNTSVTHETLSFEASEPGKQKHTTITGSGAFDLISDKDENGTYNTMAVAGTVHINWNQNITLTC